MKVLLYAILYSVLSGCAVSQSTSCVTPNGENAKCVKLRQCPLLVNAILSGDESMDLFIEASSCGIAKTCCGSSANYTQKPPAPEAVAPTSTRDIALQKYLPNKKYCGMQHWDDYFHEETDTELTSIDEFPWLLSLNNDLLCNAVLISRWYALTTTFCSDRGQIYWKFNSKNVAIFGQHKREENVSCIETDFGINDCTEPKLEIDVESYVESHKFGLALIKLKEKVSYSDYVRPICLPTQPNEMVQINQTVYSASWAYCRQPNCSAHYKAVEFTKTKWKFEVIEMNAECENETRKDGGSYFPDDIPLEDIVCLRLTTNTSVIQSGGAFEYGRPVMYKHKFNWFVGALIPIIDGPRSAIKINQDVLNWILDNMQQ